MVSPECRAQALRAFEDSIRRTQATYALAEDLLVEAHMCTDEGEDIVVAFYLLYADGGFACFETLDEVIWPTR